MFKKQGIWFVIILFFISGCASANKKTSIDILTSSPKSRIAISAVSFYSYENDKLLPMKPDDHFAYVMVSTLEEYLQEKGYAAFFIGYSKGLLTESDIALITRVDLSQAVENPNNRGKLFDPSYSTISSPSEVPWILFPVFVHKKGHVMSKIFGGPGVFEANFYAFLVNTQTGNIIWSNSYKQIGTYAAINLDLSTRFGHGTMWRLIKGIDENK
jgi:hypothetical protein